MKIQYKLLPQEERIFRDFLNQKITSREAGKLLDKSHQQIINNSTALVRQWLEEGKIKWSIPISSK